MPDLRLVAIEPTNFCNLKCKMCFAQTSDRKKGYMDMDLFYKIIEELKTIPSVGAVSVNFGGEPTLHPHFIEMLKAISGNKWRTGFATNAMMLTVPVARALISCGINQVDLSIDGVGSRLHELRPGTNYKTIKNNIEQLAKLKKITGNQFPALGINLAVTENHTIEDLFEVTGEFAGIVDMIRILPAYNDDLTWMKTHELFRKPERKEEPTECPDPNQYMAILWNGDATCCCWDHSAQTILGNIVKEKGVKNVWEGKKYKLFREKAMGSRCEGCELWKDHRGMVVTGGMMKQ
jgi:MoaA/NifB/PqqE/SkfB family radical SAM enzyme